MKWWKTTKLDQVGRRHFLLAFFTFHRSTDIDYGNEGDDDDEEQSNGNGDPYGYEAHFASSHRPPPGQGENAGKTLSHSTTLVPFASLDEPMD